MTTTTAFRARDFNHDTADPTRDRWTAGKLRHVIAALQGVPVVVITDSRTGCAEMGVTLAGLANEGASLVIDRGDVGRCSFHTFAIGDTIIPLVPDLGGARKCAAIRSYEQEVSAAIRIARGRHGVAEGRDWGRWTGRCRVDGVDVTYTPSTGNPAHADRWGTEWHGKVTLAELACMQSV